MVDSHFHSIKRFIKRDATANNILFQILNIRLTLDDLESVDPELWNSLKWILNNDITDSGLGEIKILCALVYIDF